ncbi:2-amino-4-hydroxy-6-hydroxymethyldihydropteridine diphosphokinase, partial [Dissulfurirhabdus thermomarina]
MSSPGHADAAAAPPPRRAFVGLGANIGDRRANIQAAIRRLHRPPDIRVLRCSGLYETEPVDMATPHWFLNGVAEIRTRLSPEALLEVLMAVERELGRNRALGGDRPLDLDLLYLEGVHLRRPGLQVPHPRLAERRFVLTPWAELAPGLRLRAWSATVGELLAALPPG